MLSFFRLKKISLLTITLILISTLAMFLAGCRGTSLVKITAIDDMSRMVYFEQTPERVVSLAPNITEILFALGLSERVVGVTEYCDYPEEAKNKPKVGGYFSTSLEAILNQNPDLILTDGHDPVGQSLEQMGIPILVLQPKDIFGIFRDIQVVGKIMDREKEAARLVADMQKRLNAVVDRTARAMEKPTVFYEIDATDLSKPWTSGPGSFVDSLITLAGGKNIVKASKAWLQFSLEEIVAADPDIIILGDYPYVKPQQLAERAGPWPTLKAVSLSKIYAISDPSLTSRPGPRIINGLEKIARIVHPELFP